MEMTARAAKAGNASLTDLAQSIKAASAAGIPWWQVEYVLRVEGFRISGEAASFTIERKEKP